ncbi:proton-coupled zinc antiporter SLC30A1 isoform X2 [Nerophis ophidion]|uniref:proton-coupled zinc antiporter SLC30A1 isoform X2 n=1 Tax=Nerophis ophidion TaxID=159077 RepID=UPI002AE064F8|nr:proton-coupled zinc antiporter SLC30A1 isoform X2 [Nerophis ophidion]
MKLSCCCRLGVTVLLLLLQLAISQLCRSFTTLLDGFHTLFILMHIALPHPQLKPPLGASSASVSHDLHSSLRPLGGQVSHPDSRTGPVGAFLSALLLASLCISCLMQVISFPLDPHPVERPLLLLVASLLSLLHKVVVLVWLTWNLQTGGQPEPECHLEVNHAALDLEVSRVQSETKRSSDHSGELVLCDPASSSVPDGGRRSQDPKPCKPESLPKDGGCPGKARALAQEHSPVEVCRVQSETERPSDHSGELVLCNPASSSVPEGGTCFQDLKPCKPESLPKDDGCHDHTSLHDPSSRWPFCPPTWVYVLHSMSTSVLVLITSLVLLLLGPEDYMVYLDPGLSVLAVMILVAGTSPQVHRYGLMLMQATPPHLCVSDVTMKIGNVPGVEAVHELHIWELADSLMVASVHVRCQAAFTAHRCAELMSGVTKVLQNAGVTCCTVQPEFAPSQSSSLLRNEPLVCSLSCGRVCAGHTCCPLPASQDCTGPPAPAAESTTTAVP